MTQYSGVYTLQNQGQAITSGQWATDPYYRNTTLLLHADGAPNGSQNNTFVDSSTNGVAVTRAGSTTQGTFTPYGPTWSNYFSGNYLQTPASSASTIVGTMGGSTNLTIECWIFPSSYNTTAFPAIIGDMNPTVEADYWSWGIDASGYLKIYWYDGGSGKTCSSSGAVSLNAWTHIALNINAGAMTMYINGVSQTLSGTTTLTSVAGSLGYLAIGLWNNGTGGTGGVSNGKFTGYISNLRVIKASTYTTSFTPSTSPLTSVTNTSLLTCQSNRFVDNSVNSFALTVSGTSVQRFSPFAPQYQYTPAVIGGSSYYNGSTDYLTIPVIETRSMACNIEFWFYSYGSGGVLLSNWNSGSSASTSSWTIGYDGTSTVTAYTVQPGVSYYDAGPGLASSGSAAPNTWNHVALTSDGSSTKFFINGALIGSAAYPLGGANSTNNNMGVNTYFNSGYLSGYLADVRIVAGTQIYSSAFTPPTAPLTAVANTAFLGSFTNSGIYDNAMMNDLVTAGNAQVSTGVFKYGSGSMYFDGTGDYLTLANSPSLQFGTGDFTIEAWVYPTSAVYGNIASKGSYSPGGVAGYFEFRTTNTSKLQFYDGNTDSSITSSVSVPLNTWTHVVVSRSGSIIRLFVSGIADSTLIDAGAFNNTGVFAIGAAYQSGYTNLFYGYIDDLRITKGVARYTGNFIPPKVAFANQ